MSAGSCGLTSQEKNLENLLIRRGNTADNIEVENITREAFWNLYIPGCEEHFVIHNIWPHKDFIPELYFVAAIEDRIVGCVVFTASRLENNKGIQIRTATFGPVCVLPQHQHSGIGSALINAGIDEAKKMGFPAIIILGDPHNYCRHGFKNSKDFNISDSGGKYPLGQLVLKLDDKIVIKNDNWKFFYSDVYNIDSAEVDEFENRFPKKEKLKNHSQALYSMLIRAYIE